MKFSSKHAAVICAYNASAGIVRVVEDTARYVHYILVVDDGSTDDTAKILAPLKKQLKGRLIILDHAHNKGKGAALKRAFDHCKTMDIDYVITLDADGQHNPHDIPRFILTVEKGYPLVLGQRTNLKILPSYLRATTRLVTWLTNKATKQIVHDALTGYRAFPLKVLESVKLSKDGFAGELDFLIQVLKSYDSALPHHLEIEIQPTQDKSSFRPIRDSHELVWTAIGHILKK